jgi:hypothetical protein
MASIESKSMNTPDETRSPDKTMVSVVHLGPATVARLRVEPGWRWSECIKPVVGGDSCQSAHLGYVVSGRLHIAATDGSELDLACPHRSERSSLAPLASPTSVHSSTRRTRRERQ